MERNYITVTVRVSTCELMWESEPVGAGVEVSDDTVLDLVPALME